MRTREIDRSEWREFVDSFSRVHDGWLVSMTIESRDGQRQFLLRDLPLRGVAAEVRPDRDDVVIFCGDVAHLTHVIDAPTSITTAETDDGADASLTIRNDEGARATIEFRSPMLVTLVDGLAPAL
jgi:hypothetical protein